MDPLSEPAILGGTPVRAAGPPAWPANDPEVAEALQAAFQDGSWGHYHGPHTDALAEALAEFHGCEHVILCASGTAAVELALRGAPVGPGDAVVMAAYDFKGNFQDVLTLDARPQLVDISPDTGVIDVEQLAQAIGPQTRALLVSHLHGSLVDMPAVRAVADERGIPLIEDACQVPGANVASRRAGMWGDAAVLSFGGSKLLTAGRGGAVLTNDDAIAQRIRLHTQRGNEAYPLSELQAAVLLPQLRRLDARNEQRAEAVRHIVSQLPADWGLTPFVSRGADGDVADAAYYKLGFWYDPAAWQGLSREAFATAMRAEGIAIDAGFRSLHRIHSRRRFDAFGPLPVADLADERVLVLHHPLLLEGPAGAGDFLRAAAKMRRHADRVQRAAAAGDDWPAF